jgi:hypothetical protein
MGDHEMCSSEVGAPFWSSADDDAGRPFWSDAHDTAEATAESIHLEHAYSSMSGGHSHGPLAAPSLSSRVAEGADLDEIREAAMHETIDAREASRTGLVESGDPTHVPVAGEAPQYPVADGARDMHIERSRARVGEEWTRRSAPRRRIEDDTGDYFAEGDPSMESRALAPRYDGSGDRMPDYIGTDTEFSVHREFPVERSVARDWFAQSGGADQVRAPASAAELVDGGYLDFERSTSIDYANFEETCEIMSAVAEEQEAARIAAAVPTRTPHPDIGTMLEDMALGEAAQPAPIRPRVTSAPAPEPVAPRDLSALTDLEPLADAADTSHSLGIMEGFGAVMSAWQFGGGIGDLLNGDYDNGTINTAAGGLGLGTTLASSGMLGDGAVAGALACPPAAVGAAALGLIAAGHERNAEEDLWGDATVDESGEVHHLTSLDFAMANGSDAYHGIHDSVADGLGGGVVGEGAGMLLGGLGGGLVGLGAGVVGLGGDLVGGVEATGEALAHVATAGDRYMADRDAWGPQVEQPDGSTRHRSSVDMVVDDTVATYDDWHDSAASLGLGETASSAVGGLAGGAMAVGDSALALGGNLVGLAGAGAETLGSAASSAWSWLTD